MNKPVILVTGANGQLGSELKACASTYPQFEFVFVSRAELPIHEFEKVHNYFNIVKPAFCINCAAYTAVDKAETETEMAYLINGTSTGVLAAACKATDAKFIHVSTDYVFKGNATTPYREDDAVEPVNTYGASKLKGEELAFQNNNETVVVRTSWVYSRFGNNFVKTMMRLMKERESLNVVSDQQGSPTYAADLAHALIQIAMSPRWTPGIYNYSNEGVISWYDFAVAIGEIIRSNCKVNPISSAQFPTPAKRPGYSVLDKEKIKLTYDVRIPVWRASLEQCLGIKETTLV